MGDDGGRSAMDGTQPSPADRLQELIGAAEAGNAHAAEQLFATLYTELHRLAERHLQRGNVAVTLGATTLLHEAYLNIADRAEISFPDEARFLSYASRAMRGLMIDYARRRRARKRGRHLEITLSDDAAPALDAAGAEELARLGDALDELASVAPTLAELVDLHFFCGYSFGEIAVLRGVSERTVQRDWRKARLLLHHALVDDEQSSGAH